MVVALWLPAHISKRLPRQSDDLEMGLAKPATLLTNGVALAATLFESSEWLFLSAPIFPDAAPSNQNALGTGNQDSSNGASICSARSAGDDSVR